MRQAEAAVDAVVLGLPRERLWPRRRGDAGRRRGCGGAGWRDHRAGRFAVEHGGHPRSPREAPRRQPVLGVELILHPPHHREPRRWRTPRVEQRSQVGRRGRHDHATAERRERLAGLLDRAGHRCRFGRRARDESRPEGRVQHRRASRQRTGERRRRLTDQVDQRRWRRGDLQAHRTLGADDVVACPECAGCAVLERLCLAAKPLRHREEPLTLLGHARPEALEAHPEAKVGLPPGVAATAAGSSWLERRAATRARASAASRAGTSTVACASGRGWRRKVDRADHGERPERADQEARNVETGHVLHHLAAALRDDAVGPDEGHADHHVARGAVTVTQRPPGVGGEDAAHRRALRPAAGPARGAARARRAGAAAPPPSCPPRRPRSGRKGCARPCARAVRCAPPRRAATAARPARAPCRRRRRQSPADRARQARIASAASSSVAGSSTRRGTMPTTASPAVPSRAPATIAPRAPVSSGGAGR